MQERLHPAEPVFAACKVMTCVGNGRSVVLWFDLETMQLEHDVPDEALRALFRLRLV